MTSRTLYIPIDERDPASVRVLILARTSSPGGDASDVESQVDQSLAFVHQMGWTLTHPDDPYRYTETKSGMRQVRRPVLRQVLGMAQRGEVDVILCLKLARIDRKPPRRYAAMQIAEEYGVEFRFVNHPETRGKMPEGERANFERFIEDMYDEREAKEIADRLAPGRRKRYELGLPHGGVAGPLFGYANGERKYKGDRGEGHGKPMGLQTWVIDEQKAQHVRWLFATVDATPLAKLSGRALARQLEARTPTATGSGRWSVTQVIRLLRNPKYAGLGRNLRYKTDWTKVRDPIDHKYYDVVQTIKRVAEETYPIPTSAIPPIIDAEQFARVQAKLDAVNAQNNRGGPRRTDAAAHASLLDGFVFCAHCGGKLTRYWHKHSGLPYYRCGRRAAVPDHPCMPHEVQAAKLDDLALRLLADVLSDPEKVVALADAAEHAYTTAHTEAELAAASLDAYRGQLDRIAADRERQEKKLRLCDPDEKEEIAIIQAKITKLDDDRAAIETEATHTQPAQQRASDRAEMLDGVRRGVFAFMGEGETWNALAVADLLGATPADIGADYNLMLERAGLPPIPAPLAEDAAVEELYTLEQNPKELAYYVLNILARAPKNREAWYTLLRDLDIKAYVSRPRSRAEWATLGPTPVEDRTELEVLGLVRVRTNAAKLSQLAKA